MCAARLDRLPKSSPSQIGNASKWLLWEDPLLGTFGKALPKDVDVVAHYRQLSEQITSNKVK